MKKKTFLKIPSLIAALVVAVSAIALVFSGTASVSFAEETAPAFAEDGSYYVETALTKADGGDFSWGAVFANNQKMLVTVSNGAVSKVEFATNPAQSGKYESALTGLKIGSEEANVLSAAAFTTLPAGKDIQYMARGAFLLPDDLQPAQGDEKTSVPVQVMIPNSTDGDSSWADAKLTLNWKSMASTKDDQIKQDATIASADNSAIISSDPAVVTVKPEGTVSPEIKVINGKDYELSYASEDEDIATVNGSGKIAGVSKGNTEITVTAAKGEEDPLTRTIKVSVQEETTYSIDIAIEGNGNAEADPTSGATGTKVTLTQTPAEGNQFKEWKVESGDVTIAEDNTFTIGTSDVKITAVFEEIEEPEYKVTVNKEGNGTAEADVTSGKEGTKVTLTATPDTGYQFKEWTVVSGGITIADDNTFTIGTSDVEVTAVFEEIPAPEYKVTVKTEGKGTAKADVTSGKEGTEVTLTATPDTGYQFKEWKTVPSDLKITDNKFKIGTADVEVTAVFEEIPATEYKVTVKTEGNGKAEADVTSGKEGTKVTLTATPDTGYQLKEWKVVSGGITIADDNTFTIGTSDVEVTAVFEKTPAGIYTVKVEKEGEGVAVAVPDIGTEGTKVTLTAKPATGYKFKEWQVIKGGVTIGEDDTFTIGTEDVEIKAVFEAGESKTYTDPTTKIAVTDSTGVLPDGARLSVTEITSGTDYDKVKNSSYVTGHRFKLYDIHFEDKDGNKLSPTGRFAISIPMPSGWDTSNLMLIHYYDSGLVTSVAGSVSDGHYKFTTASFSNFALVERKANQETTTKNNQTTTTRRNTVTTTTRRNTVTTTVKRTSVRTADDSNLASWIALLAAAGVAIGVMVVIRKRQTR